jgi:hypothetical protein
MNDAGIIGENLNGIADSVERMRVFTRFICTPGSKPVKVPAATPNRIAMRISSNIYFYNTLNQ